MKPQNVLIAGLLFSTAGLTAVASDRLQTEKTETWIAALPVSPVWVRIRQPVSVEELSSQLSLDETRLAKLNDVDEDHQFRRGEWLVLPAQVSTRLPRLSSVDTSELRRTPPLETPPPPPLAAQNQGSINAGNSIVQIARRYGLSNNALLRFKPSADPVADRPDGQARIAQLAPYRSRAVFGLMPGTSGGMSYPETPEYETTPEPTQPNLRLTPQVSFIWPAQGVFTSGYGWRWGRMHKGIDVANNVGTPVVAAQRGRVVFARWHDGGYGYLVEILHEDGTTTRYGHNSQLLVQEGQEVAQGQVISQMGSTGRSTGPHLHFEIRPPGQGAVNPLQYLPPKA